MRKGKGCEERRTGRGGKALMVKLHGGESEAKTKAQGAKMGSVKVKNRRSPFPSDL
jgi:hypothetical protein